MTDQTFVVRDLGTVRWPDDLDFWERPLVFSYGAGLDSWYAAVRLMESPDPVWVGLRRKLAAIIHDDLGAELPETTAHFENVARPFMAEHGWDVTVIEPNVVCKNEHRHRDIRSYLECQAVIPSRTSRWCSQRFKIDPIQKAARHLLRAPIWQGFDTLLGYDASEGHRTKRLSQKQRDRLVLPLMTLGLDRPTMTAQLRAEGWPEWTIPPKSRCSFCIFSKVGEIREIAAQHPEILEADIQTEERIIATNGRPEFTFLHRPLRAIRDS